MTAKIVFSSSGGSVVGKVGAPLDRIADALNTGLLLATPDGAAVWRNQALARLVGAVGGTGADAAPAGLPLSGVRPGAPPVSALWTAADGTLRRLSVTCHRLDELLLYEVVEAPGAVPQEKPAAGGAVTDGAVTERTATAPTGAPGPGTLDRDTAEHDALTGLLSRRAITERLSELAAARTSGALLLLDIDNFKDVNDMRGNATGDEVMRALGRLLRECLPASAILGRFGGDEFAAVLAEGDPDEALATARSLCQVVADAPLALPGGTIGITLSIGAAPVDGEADGDVLLAHADLALHEAKRSGRNRARLFAPAQYRHAVQRVNMLRRVHDALLDERLELDAQPIVDLGDRRVTSYELLVRLRDGIYPDVGPADFLPALERGDLVQELDRWVVGQAIRALAQSPAPLPADSAAPLPAQSAVLCLDVNVSSRSLEDPGFGDWVVDSLRRAGVSPDRLGLEITETAAISNLDAARRLAATITSAGCRFSLDDFGAGFGSFVYLKHLPFTTVKIAGEFVRQADQGRIDRVLVEAVVRAANGLGMSTVAEYVDREPLVAALHSLGVDRGQGYHLGRPVPLRVLLRPRVLDDSPTEVIWLPGRRPEAGPGRAPRARTRPRKADAEPV